ncbi:membrane protein insertase YidC [Catenulispora sp. NL8]|uniref:Membrane protein insertase YidC n=1 Tax=Catenulispora pinistramenti TaxID=2705254 RepID=A0ABS5KRD6_9ACTN|nr:membrane protein insertase YidC [Catenulispora pinistramenti]MBS2548611.1 membrane protein insertase YidC [Catenulispora pinistramenti]
MPFYSLLTPAIVAAYHAVTGLSVVLVPVLGGLGPAVAIVVFTAAVRLCLHPLNRAQMTAQLSGQKARAALAPAVQKLQRKYKNDPLRAQRETVELYRANGVKLAPGIGLGLVQIPVFIVVYRLFVSPTIGGHHNALLSDQLFGVGLGSHFRDVFSGSSVALGHAAVFVGLIAALAVLATWSSRRMRASAALDAVPVTGASTPAPGVTKLMSLLPYFSVLGAVVLPVASSLYVATTTLWTLVERRRMVVQPAQS